MVGAWKIYQQRPPKYSRVKYWDAFYNGPNWGLITGQTSGIVVLDIDDWNKAIEWINSNGGIPETITVKTSSDKKRHIYFRWPGQPVLNTARKWPGADFRGDGGYVVTVGSTHQNGKQYSWEIEPGNCELADLPDWLLREIYAKVQNKPKKTETPATTEDLLDAFKESDRQRYTLDALVSGVNQGERNHTGFCIAMYLLDNKVKPADIYPALSLWNSKNRPPMDDQEVATIANSAVNYWERKNQHQTQSALTRSEALENLSRFVALNITGVYVEDDDYHNVIVEVEDPKRGLVRSRHITITTYREWAMRFAQNTGGIVPFMPDKFPHSLNNEFIRLLYAAAEILALPDDATIAGIVKKALAELTEDAVFVANPKDEVPLNYGEAGETIVAPFVFLNNIYIDRRTLRLWIRRYTSDKITDQAITKAVTALGWNQVRKQFGELRGYFYVRRDTRKTAQVTLPPVD